MPSLDEPRSEKSVESDSESDSDLDVLDVTVTRTIVNSEAQGKKGISTLMNQLIYHVSSFSDFL